MCADPKLNPSAGTTPAARITKEMNAALQGKLVASAADCAAEAAAAAAPWPVAIQYRVRKGSCEGAFSSSLAPFTGLVQCSSSTRAMAAIACRLQHQLAGTTACSDAPSPLSDSDSSASRSADPRPR